MLIFNTQEKIEVIGNNLASSLLNATKWLEHRTPDRNAWFDARCHQTPSEYTRSTCSLNQWVRSLVGLITSAGTGEYFPPLQSTCRNCGGGDRGRVAIYRPFGEFRRAKCTVTCMVLNDRRTSLPMPR
ncbi:hypothetical protein TNCV_3583371 [Trichonephila clavipes]|nr:hypothetical protein TNCV_3583371 [Trichonephila clavipes]